MKYLMCNLKSNKDLQQILAYKKKIAQLNKDNKEFVLFPPNIYLPFFYDAEYKIGTQTISKYERGNHTGEVLAYQLKSLHVSYALINHCEMEEQPENVLAKIKNAIKEQIKVVLCIGKHIKNNENMLEITKQQIEELLDKLTPEEIENIILAFEPCFAINQEDILSPSLIEKIVKNLKEMVNYKYNVNIKIIYGGSIKVDNFHKLLEIDNLDGYLIGNCANNPENILKIASIF